MINDYHALRIVKNINEMPDNMVHALAKDVELTMLERKVRPEEIAILYESLRRQEPRIHGITVEDGVRMSEKLG